MAAANSGSVGRGRDMRPSMIVERLQAMELETCNEAAKHIAQLEARLEAIARVTISDDIHAMARGQADGKVQAIIGGF